MTGEGWNDLMHSLNIQAGSYVHTSNAYVYTPPSANELHKCMMEEMDYADLLKHGPIQCGTPAVVLEAFRDSTADPLDAETRACVHNTISKFVVLWEQEDVDNEMELSLSSLVEILHRLKLPCIANGKQNIRYMRYRAEKKLRKKHYEHHHRQGLAYKSICSLLDKHCVNSIISNNINDAYSYRQHDRRRTLHKTSTSCRIDTSALLTKRMPSTDACVSKQQVPLERTTESIKGSELPDSSVSSSGIRRSSSSGSNNGSSNSSSGSSGGSSNSSSSSSVKNNYTSCNGSQSEFSSFLLSSSFLYCHNASLVSNSSETKKEAHINYGRYSELERRRKLSLLQIGTGGIVYYKDLVRRLARAGLKVTPTGMVTFQDAALAILMLIVSNDEDERIRELRLLEQTNADKSKRKIKLRRNREVKIFVTLEVLTAVCVIQSNWRIYRKGKRNKIRRLSIQGFNNTNSYSNNNINAEDNNNNANNSSSSNYSSYGISGSSTTFSKIASKDTVSSNCLHILRISPACNIRSGPHLVPALSSSSAILLSSDANGMLDNICTLNSSNLHSDDGVDGIDVQTLGVEVQSNS